jgi:hypothetical protein
LRDVVRYRKRLIEDRAREANRVEKVLETANIKLGSVVTDVLGVSARAMLKALIAGTGTPEELAELAQRRMRRKRAALGEALTGRVSAHHRFLLAQLLHHVGFSTTPSPPATATSRRSPRPMPTPSPDSTRFPASRARTAEVIAAELGCDDAPDRRACRVLDRPLPGQPRVPASA